MAKSSRQTNVSRKRGDKKNEMALKHRKKIGNFKTSKDVREDRGRRQTKLGGSKQGFFGRR